MRKVLLMGAGSNHDKQYPCHMNEKWCGDLVTLDFNADHKPDIVADLGRLPYDWARDNEYNEVHAYDVLEHTGQQGDWKFFFDQFSEIHRILKPNGLLVASVPQWNSMWAWGDPSHTRIISLGTIGFLSQRHYNKNVGVTKMSDFRFYYKADFELEFHQESSDLLTFGLRAVK